MYVVCPYWRKVHLVNSIMDLRCTCFRSISSCIYVLVLQLRAEEESGYVYLCLIEGGLLLLE